MLVKGDEELGKEPLRPPLYKREHTAMDELWDAGGGNNDFDDTSDAGGALAAPAVEDELISKTAGG